MIRRYTLCRMRVCVLLLPLIISLCSAQRTSVSSEVLRVDDPRIKAILEGICPSAVGLIQNHWECKNCPEQTSDGEHHLTLPWPVDEAIFGYFSQSQSREAILSSRSCEPHSEGSGGTFLLKEEAGRWRRVSYKKGLVVSMCHAFRRRSGLDLLVCRDSWGNVSESGENLFELDYAIDAGGRAKDLVSTRSSNSCAVEDGGGYVQQAYIEGLRVAGNRIIVTASHASAPYQSTDECVSLIVQPIRGRKFSIIFLFDGSHFSLVAGKGALALLNSER
jgi:hypothetical protein